jgi:serine/threonine protein phosphatase PrpC
VTVGRLSGELGPASEAHPVSALRWGAASDVGRLRTVNQDSMLVSERLFAVADGMGGHAAGEVASALAIAEFERLSSAPTLSAADLDAGVARANAAIVATGRTHGDQLGLGTTLAALGWVQGADGPRWAVCNVGDSRVYRWAEGLLTQLTEDHSEVQELISAGHLSPEDARHYPRRNVVTRSLGSEPAPIPDIGLLVPVAGDRFLLCSDGLTNELTDTEIAHVLHQCADPQQAAGRLVEEANTAGGRDNITVVVVDLVG